MAPADLLLVAVRWAHSAAAVAWVGGSLFLLLVLEPALRATPASDALAVLRRLVYQGFRELADASIVVFVVSGAVLVFDRLAGSTATPLYAAVLGLKVVLAVLMFILAYRLRQAPLPERSTFARWQVGLGALVLLLASLLKTLYESGVRA